MKLKKIIANNLFMLKYFVKFAPAYVALSVIAMLLVAADSVVCNSILINYMYNALSRRSPLSEIFIVLGLVAALLFVRYLLVAFLKEYLKPKTRAKLLGTMQSDLFSKAVKMDLSCYDNPDFYNDFVWAASGVENRAFEIFDSVMEIFSIIVTSIGYFSVVFALNPAILIPAVASMVVQCFTSARNVKINYEKELELKPQTRRRDYAARVFYLKDYAKEIRTSHISDSIFGGFKRAVAQVKAISIRHGKRLTLVTAVVDLLNDALIINFGVYAYLAYQLLVPQTITVGVFMSVSFATENVAWRGSRLINLLPTFAEYALYVDKFRTFLAYTPKIVGGKLPAPNSGEIKLENLSFSYGGAPVLKNISMTLRQNEKIAIVGYNGAGKTTLIKLLMRLYDPSDGKVSLDGIDIRDCDLEQYLRRFGAVFQDFTLFAADIGQNVVMDNINYDENEVKAALSSSGFSENLEGLKGGLLTQLTREFDENGVVFSGGEAQKIAIARVFYKNCPFIILDEPSSALDPIAEYNLNAAMARAAQDKTVIFISHRLAATKMADRIYMLENGEIIEQGSHAQLMALGGKYAEMWHLQAQKYA